ncbi:MAG: prepilin-type N-terminal cleavage/methylation domain-containing protein [Deltaproteobacteria bacterium]|nr:prepilin-type N-terminal cleavage/methylation domain-containing protein [Deltaproteobacteria bacterium]
MKNKSIKSFDFKGGFSFIEMLVVVIIMGVLLAVIVPVYMTIVPRGELKADSKAIMTLMLKARMSASSYQRPVRVLLDCTQQTREFGGGKNPCRLDAQIAIYTASGAIKGWRQLPATDVELHKGTDLTYLSNVTKKKPQYEFYKSFFKGFYALDGSGPRTYGVHNEDGFNSDSFVVVFTPGGEAVTYCPMDIKFANNSLGEKSTWRLSIVNSTGHARLKEM